MGQAGYHQADTACPIAEGTWEAAYWSAQTAVAGADAIAGGERAAYALCRPPGHHAFADLAGGFCFLCNAAIAAERLLRAGRRPAILDVDVHHGNGTQGVFYRRADVLTVSIHADPARFYPFFWGHAQERGEGVGLGANLNLPLDRGTGDDDYLRALDTALERITAFGADVLVVALGLDAHENDPFQGLAVTTPGFSRIGGAIAGLGLPTLFVQEGGYLSDDLSRNLESVLTGFQLGMSTADVVVIGGGIAGISAAAELAAEMRVTVIEAEPRIGYHATGRSAALFIRNYGNATLRALNAVAAPLLADPGEGFDGPLLSRRGELLVAGEAELPALEEYAAGATGLERLDAGAAAAIVPILRPEPIAAALLEADAQDIDVDRLLQGYARRLRRRGGTVMTGCGTTCIERTGDEWRVETAQGSVTAPILVNAAGAWADEVAGLAGVPRIGLTPMRRSAALLPAPAGHEIDRWPLFGDVSETWYAKPDAGKLMVSPADEDPVDPHDAWPDDMVLAEGLDRFERATTVSVTRVERSWAGLRTFAPDRTPVAGFDPAAPGFFWLAGQGGYGVQTSAALAALTAALCLGHSPILPRPVVAALSPSRFSGS